MNLRRSLKRYLAQKGIKVSVKPSTSSTSNFDEDAIIQKYLGKMPSHNKFVVDIAAADGLWMSNTFALFNAGYAGVALEYNPERFAKLADWYQFFPEARLLRCKALPHNIIELLQTTETPEQFGFLNLDVDSYDHFILQKMLTAYRPSLMCIEINERIPYPIKFTVNYHPTHFWQEDHFFGQSLAKLHELCTAFGYELVELQYNNAFYVPKELNSFGVLNPAEAFQNGFVNKADRKVKFPKNEEVEPLLTMPPQEAMAWLEQHFDQKYKGMYSLEL